MMHLMYRINAPTEIHGVQFMPWTWQYLPADRNYPVCKLTLDQVQDYLDRGEMELKIEGTPR